MTPTIYLTNFSSRRLHGPGAVYTMMGAPRAFEEGQGRVQVLRPHGADELRLMRAALAERKAGQTGDALARYKRALEARWTHQAGLLAPGALLVMRPAVFATSTVIDDCRPVEDGDTVCCGCSRDHAGQGLCHRAWAAPFLVRAGWRVILDGVEVTLG